MTHFSKKISKDIPRQYVLEFYGKYFFYQKIYKIYRMEMNK